MSKDEKETKFPEGFLWGASTSAHQVEGNNHNQWTKWETENAERLAAKAKKVIDHKYLKQDVWARVRKQAENPKNYISGQGVDHYNRYKEDFDILQSLNFNSFRFGIEWSRIEPEEGQWDNAQIDHYKRYIAELKSRNIEPVINIWHWTNPIWFEAKGAFTKRNNLKYFDRFVQKVTDELLDGHNYVIVINEANVYSVFSYFLGLWPPQKRSVFKMLRVYKNLTLAQKNSYSIIKAKYPTIKVGAAQNASLNIPKNKFNLVSQLVAAGANYFWQDWFYSQIKNHQDFVGANFYRVNRVSWFKVVDYKRSPSNDLSWYMEPRAVGEMAERLYRKFKTEIIITENGVADSEDQYRQWWLEETIKGLEDAINRGVDVKGYFHWSLLDNFEWANGWWPKFGLVAVDREHDMKRTVRGSAKWFAVKIKDLS